MNMNDKTMAHEPSVPSHAPAADLERGFYASATIMRTPKDIFAFCQNAAHIEQVLTDLPMDLENFIDFKLVSAEKIGPDIYTIEWINKPDSKIAGKLLFAIKSSPLKRGSILTTTAYFEKLRTRDSRPSNFMNLFVKRLKALAETGEIPTTQGQPSGREEINITEENNLH